jgi:hypothetical protein
MRIRISVINDPVFRWILPAMAICAFDVLGWLFWRGTWDDGLDVIALWALAGVGFRLSYEIGFATKKLTMTVLRPGRRYRIAGPDGIWVVVGLSTSMNEHGGQVEVTLIDEADYERRFVRKG